MQKGSQTVRYVRICEIECHQSVKCNLFWLSVESLGWPFAYYLLANGHLVSLGSFSSNFGYYSPKQQHIDRLWLEKKKRSTKLAYVCAQMTSSIQSSLVSGGRMQVPTITINKCLIIHHRLGKAHLNSENQSVLVQKFSQWWQKSEGRLAPSGKC